MRRIVMFNRVSADGYFADSSGTLQWVVQDADVDRQGASGIPRVDTFLLGRRTYEMFASFWPHVLDDPDAKNPHAGGRLSPEHRAMAKALNESIKVVFSKSLETASWENSRIVRQVDPRAIEALKRQPGRDMMVLGSGSIVSQLTEHGLIDEYQLVVSPCFVGDGQPLIRGVPKGLRLNLVSLEKTSSGSVMLRYERSP